MNQKRDSICQYTNAEFQIKENLEWYGRRISIRVDSIKKEEGETSQVFFPLFIYIMSQTSTLPMNRQAKVLQAIHNCEICEF